MLAALDPLIPQIVENLRREHGCHTVILYGSRARGDFTATSDYDILGVRSDGPTERDARLWQGVFLDIFVFPEAKLENPDRSLIYMLGGTVLVEQGDVGTCFLKKLQAVFDHGPEPVSADEIKAKRVWAWKMLERAKVDDLEGRYRRHWLLTALLEDYFVVRGLWYLGPKGSLQWLSEHDQTAASVFANALRSDATFTDLEALVQLVSREPNPRN